MRIIRFQILNYKCFRDTGYITLDRQRTLIVGKNDSGKSSLLECLGTQIYANPHLSSKSKPRISSAVDDVSRVRVSLEIAGRDIRDYLLVRNQNAHIPHSAEIGNDHNKVLARFGQILEGGPYGFDMEFVQGSSGALVSTSLFASYSTSSTPSQTGEFWTLGVAPNRGDFVVRENPINGRNLGGWGEIIGTLLRSRIYRFTAERLKIGETNAAPQELLIPDASNLPAVVDHLQSRNRVRFERYERLVREIFPNIRVITARRKEGQPQQIEIALTKETPEIERSDLYTPLALSGTGLGQVMALLLAAVQSEVPKILVIDEPNSFLHPGAARKLIESLKTFTQHQLILSTHAPEVIASALPAGILVIRFEQDKLESTVQPEDSASKSARELLLREIGVSLSDVFSAEKILWVEGATEVEVFRRLLHRRSDKESAGVEVLPVVHTSDIDLRDRERKLVLSVYQSLSSGTSMIPPAIGFIFDRETRTEDEMRCAADALSGKVHFLARRMIENYFLNASSVSAVLNSVADGQAKIEPSDVDKRLQAASSNTLYFRRRGKSGTLPSDGNDWRISVHGARVLQDVFWEFATTEYDKKLHGGMLCEWILEHDPSALDDLVNLLDTILGNAETKA
jgi:energy-coupling factor transporter ATP-binding protein EcfA2